MSENSGITGSVRPDHGKQGSIQIPYPKFDLGRTSRQFDRPLRKVYATIDRDGEQIARSLPTSGNLIGTRQSFLSRWMDWRRR